MGQEGQCSSPVALDTSNVPGLRQGSKLHHILQQQGDLQQLPAWLLGSTTSHSPGHLFTASPTIFSRQLLQQHSEADTTASRSEEGAASDEIIAELSLALAALQETILQVEAARCTKALVAGTEVNAARKRLRFDADMLPESPVLQQQQQQQQQLTVSVHDGLQALHQGASGQKVLQR